MVLRAVNQKSVTVSPLLVVPTARQTLMSTLLVPTRTEASAIATFTALGW